MASPAALLVSNLAKRYPGRETPVLRDLNFSLAAGERLAILGRNGQGKSTLIKMLGGVLAPTSGAISWSVTRSWPIGFAGGFQGSLTGYDNIRFLSRLYNKPISETLKAVEDFAELGEALTFPVKHYSSGMRARLAFGLSLAIEFDCYLIDELVAVGDSRFQKKCEEELFVHRADKSFILASHDTNVISRHCSQALVVEAGYCRLFRDIDEALDVYKWLKAP